MKSLGTQLTHWIVFGACFLVSIEIASRIDQWLAYGAPLLGVYTYDSSLFTADEFGIRGKPNGRYEKWRLNSFGFRGEEIEVDKSDGVVRVVCIGASETFGLYETPGREWPRQLEEMLTGESERTEVINGAIAGMSLSQRTRHLQHRLLRFSPDVVVFMVEYGSYAGLTNEKIAARRQGRVALPDRSGILEGLKTLRVVSRVKDVVLPRFPTPIQELVGGTERNLRARLIQQELGAQYRSFTHVRPFEVQAFKDDLEELSAVTEQAGVKLIVLSPAM